MGMSQIKIPVHFTARGFAMRIGFTLPNIGPVASAEAVSKVAQRAEALGFDSLWTTERLLYPVKPQTPYPVTPDGSLPEPYKHALDPLEALTFAAAQTKKIALGPSVLDIPYYNPVMLARRLTTLDLLSNGRLQVGFGLGWSKDGYLAAFAPPAMKRLARMADGWNAVAIPVEGMARMFGTIKEMAKEVGRDPSSLQMIVRANLEITDRPLGKERTVFTGTLDQIKEDVSACSKVGAHEVFFDPTFSTGEQSLDRWLALMEQLRRSV
jgi:alkanesulfonate monooxygenase SsuD/methylene tetrahydromethanopterin reductase-like flavin-dependent oxidoreductase (luciferase family)